MKEVTKKINVDCCSCGKNFSKFVTFQVDLIHEVLTGKRKEYTFALVCDHCNQAQEVSIEAVSLVKILESLPEEKAYLEFLKDLFQLIWKLVDRELRAIVDKRKMKNELKILRRRVAEMIDDDN